MDLRFDEMDLRFDEMDLQFSIPDVPRGTKEILRGTKEILRGTKEILRGTKEVRRGREEVQPGRMEVRRGGEEDAFSGAGEPVRKFVFGVKPRHKATMRKNQNRKSEALNQALDALIEETGHSPEAILGDGGVLAQMTKALIERVLCALR